MVKYPQETDLKNGIVSGIGWGDQKRYILAFNGVLGDLEYWADVLELAPVTLRKKLYLVRNKRIKFETAMLNKAQRKQFYRPVRSVAPNIISKDEALSDAFNKFCFGGRNVGAR